VSALFAREGFYVHQRRPCDCMRGAIATYLGLPYELTPDISGLDDATTFWSDWTEWLAGCGLALTAFACAPGHLQRWIAIVGGTPPGPMHAVVMRGTELLHDPAPEPNRLRSVAREDVLCAMVIGGRDDTAWPQRISAEMSAALAAGSQDCWCLARLMDAPWNVELLRLRGQLVEAEQMRARLDRVEHRWPAASIAPAAQARQAI